MSEAGAVAMPMSLTQAADWLREHFDPEAGRELQVAYQIELSGPEGGSLGLRIDNGQLALSLGPLAEADVTLRMTALDFFAILGGRANADMLFMEDRIEVKGDLSLVLKLRQLFRRR